MAINWNTAERYENVTLTHRVGFGYQSLLARYVLLVRAPYAQYADALHVQYVEKGKRKPRGFALYDGKPLILSAGDNRQALRQDALTAPERDCGLIVQKSRWTCFAPEWDVEFAGILAQAEAKGVQVVFRHHAPKVQEAQTA